MTNKTFKSTCAALLLAACHGAAVAAPTLPQVVAGQASFSRQGNVFSITNTPSTIINWQSFSVEAGEVTRFIQQSADSAVLNRILGQDPSRILGALQSNGKVFLINPNGVVFGRDSRVDVGGLVATSLGMSNADFLAGRRNFAGAANAGAVTNDGAITTPSGGQVLLIGPKVGNTGIITSPKGEVVLAAGHSVQLADSRDPDMHVVVSAPQDQSINLGQVLARGGRIGIYAALVSQRGAVSADSAVIGENGKIVLKASRDTILGQGSVTIATGAGSGGEIHLLGQNVGIEGNAAVDASGALGGGTVLAGGDLRGANALLMPHAQQTWLSKDATIRVDALASGNGGKVVLWSSGTTRAFGGISARGGAAGGNGGQVETSGHNLASHSRT
jgi:filamentous hemagglutinin family protein